MNKQLSRMSGDSCNRQISHSSRRVRSTAVILGLLLLPQIGHAFLFPEHRDVTVRASTAARIWIVRYTLVKGRRRSTGFR